MDWDRDGLLVWLKCCAVYVFFQNGMKMRSSHPRRKNVYVFNVPKNVNGAGRWGGESDELKPMFPRLSETVTMVTWSNQHTNEQKTD